MNGGVKFSSYSSTLPRVVDAKIKPSGYVNHESGSEKSRISGIYLRLKNNLGSIRIGRMINADEHCYARG